MAKEKVKVALVGAGGMANSMHYPSLAEFEDVEMAGLCDLVEDKLNATADKFGIEKRYSDYRKMIEEVAPDAVYVLMPPYHLFDIAAHCLSQKLHVFIEKPPGVTTFQTTQLALQAEQNGCLTMVGFQRRHIPIVVELRKRLEERSPLHQCVSTFYKNQPDRAYYGGAMDILTCDAIHAVDSIRWMAGGEVKSVASDVRNLFADQPNAHNAIITFTTGCTGILLTNWATGRRFFTVEMHAKGISAYVDPDEKGYLYADNDVEGEEFDPKEVAGGEEGYKALGFFQENRHFIDCIKNGQQPTSCFRDAVKTMELVDRIYHSQI